MFVSPKTLLTLSAVLALPLGACSDGKKKDPSGPCVRGELIACGAECSASSACPSGLYCDDGLCHAECTGSSAADSSTNACRSGQACSIDGRCTDEPSRMDGGNRPDAAGDAGTGGELCGQVMLDTEPQTPNVILILDQSGSMSEKFGSGTRWDVLKASLLADNGLIAELQDRVRFGVTLYTSKNGTMEGKACPLLTETTVAINNLEAIRAVYQPARYVDDTPTGAAVNAVLDKWTASAVLDPQYSSDPTIFILATDGEPDTCEKPDGNNTNVDGRPQSVAAVTRAFMAGIRTYVIAVADEDDLSQEHVDDLANAGVGKTGSPAAPSFRPDSDQGLRDALRSIVSGVVSCDVPLKGEVVAGACEATVKLGGELLSCSDADGFELLNASLIRVKGKACRDLKAGKLLTASFPCGGAIPIF